MGLVVVPALIPTKFGFDILNAIKSGALGGIVIISFGIIGLAPIFEVAGIASIIFIVPFVLTGALYGSLIGGVIAFFLGPFLMNMLVQMTNWLRILASIFTAFLIALVLQLLMLIAAGEVTFFPKIGYPSEHQSWFSFVLTTILTIGILSAIYFYSKNGKTTLKWITTEEDKNDNRN